MMMMMILKAFLIASHDFSWLIFFSFLKFSFPFSPLIFISICFFHFGIIVWIHRGRYDRLPWMTALIATYI